MTFEPAHRRSDGRGVGIGLAVAGGRAYRASVTTNRQSGADTACVCASDERAAVRGRVVSGRKRRRIRVTSPCL
jgi:hypothetical protein